MASVKKSLVDKLKKIYHSSPLIVIKTYSFCYSVWIKIRSYWLPAHQYTGVARDGGKTLNFSYLGWNYQVSSYWLVKLFDSYEQIPGKKLVSVWRISKFLRNNTTNTDLALVELLNKPAMKRARTSTGFILPRWLKAYMDVDLSLKSIKKRNDIHRRIRKHSLGSEISSSPDDFELFYERMHKPYVESRHRDAAYVEDYKKMLQDFKKKNSTLYFVTKDGSKVAGMYEQNPDGIPYMYGLGVLDGSEDIMKMGVVGALYYFALADHRENNIKRVNVGGTSPLLSDGLTRYKFSLGAMASEFQYQDSIRLLLMPLGNTPVVKDILSSNPFTYFEGKNMYCAIFKDNSDEDSEAEFQRLYKKTGTMGLKETRVFCFNTDYDISECSP